MKSSNSTSSSSSASSSIRRRRTSHTAPTASPMPAKIAPIVATTPTAFELSEVSSDVVFSVGEGVLERCLPPEPGVASGTVSSKGGSIVKTSGDVIVGMGAKVAVLSVVEGVKVVGDGVGVTGGGAVVDGNVVVGLIWVVVTGGGGVCGDTVGCGVGGATEEVVGDGRGGADVTGWVVAGLSVGGGDGSVVVTIGVDELSLSCA
ncbi:hypothetical protein H310_10018 [Aphanomyces invadans]|uniref:Uncharacterized protein n=1 Tax=Aphanomyces invadans TaxID=157072 RepID=A0A024TRB9_9STRA|nr:hypothetical protein H310_10018 [Aphanomyces invadans]ETV96700.1 hypothetical protein H310_10018 [Aphanomyces invadans]|eukprot:XP_008874477.1 hypothetical protein H310_10018 [Aphanomyces invadans]